MWERFRRALLNSLSTTLLHIWKWVAAFWRKNGLLTLSMLSVATGCLLGFLLRALELTELVSLAGMGTGARGMEQGSWGNQPWCQQDITIKGPRWAQPQKQRLLPKETTPQGRFLAVAFFFSFFDQKAANKCQSCRTNPASLHWEWGAPGQTLLGCRRLQVDGNGKGGNGCSSLG